MSDYAYDDDADQPYPTCDRCGMQDDTVRVYEAAFERDPSYCPDCAAAINAELDANERSDAPNAANAAPLMPECDACGGTGIAHNPRPWMDAAETCPTCAGTGRLRATREGFPAIIRPGHLGADEQLPAYAWPGGYPLAYMPGTLYRGTYSGDQDLIDTNGTILCAECATESLHNPDEWSDEDAITGVLEDGDREQNTTCDGCNAVIAYQNYCYDCRESVDCDEDAPFHLCPATEPYTVRYLTHVPGTDWIKAGNTAYGPDEARVFAQSLRERMGAAFVHYQPSRLDFPPVVEEED